MRKTLLALALIFTIGLAFAQTTFYSESMGTAPSTTAIAAHEAANNFDVDSATYSGTADLRNTTASTGYTGASGLANVFFTNTIGRYMLVEGINSSAYSNITMTLGHYKNNALANNELTIEVSSDGSSWTQLTYTHTGAAGWVLISPAGTIPSATNLRLRFTQAGSVYQPRIDDIKLSGTSSSPTITVSTPALTGFNYVYGNGPSSEQTFTISGSFLTNDISLSSVSTNYEISESSGNGFTNSITLYKSGTSVPTTTIYVHLASGLAVGLYNLQNIVCTSTNAITQNVACSGYVSPAPPATGIEINFEGTGEEKTGYGSGTVTLSGYDFNLTQALIGTAPEDVKFGVRAARLRYDGTTYGSISMLEPKSDGIGTISFYYSRSNFSGDRTGIAPIFVVEYSTDNSNWIQTGAATDLTGIDQPTLFSSVVNVGGDIYFRIRQTGGDSSKRWNVDDIQLTDYEDEEELPVELSSFTAILSSENYVSLTWVTQTETGVQGYYIYRSSNDQLANAQIVSPMIDATNTSQQQSYVYTDTELDTAGTYYYWLQNVDFDGSNLFHGPISVYYGTPGDDPTPGIPMLTELKGIYPNPFNPLAFIPFSIARTANVNFMIYNTRGQLVRQFALGNKVPGNYRIEWNGTDYNGQTLGNGIYYIKMLAGREAFQRKAVLLK